MGAKHAVKAGPKAKSAPASVPSRAVESGDDRPSKRAAACCSACKKRPGVVEWAQSDGNRVTGDQCMSCFTNWTSHFAYLKWSQYCSLYATEAGVRDESHRSSQQQPEKML